MIHGLEKLFLIYLDNLSKTYKSIVSVDGRLRMNYFYDYHTIYIQLNSLQTNNVNPKNDLVEFDESFPDFYSSDTIFNDGASTNIYYSFIERRDTNKIKFTNNYQTDTKKTIRSNFIPFRRIR